MVYDGPKTPLLFSEGLIFTFCGSGRITTGLAIMSMWWSG